MKLNKEKAGFQVLSYPGSSEKAPLLRRAQDKNLKWETEPYTPGEKCSSPKVKYAYVGSQVVEEKDINKLINKLKFVISKSGMIWFITEAHPSWLL